MSNPNTSILVASRTGHRYFCSKRSCWGRGSAPRNNSNHCQQGHFSKNRKSWSPRQNKISWKKSCKLHWIFSCKRSTCFDGSDTCSLCHFSYPWHGWLWSLTRPRPSWRHGEIVGRRVQLFEQNRTRFKWANIVLHQLQHTEPQKFKDLVLEKDFLKNFPIDEDL